MMRKTRTALAMLAALALILTMAGLVLATDEPETTGEPEATGGSVPVDAIEGITWQLVEQSVDEAAVPVPDGVVVTLILEGGDAGGSGGCNSYFAAYELDGASIAFSEIGSTMMACLGPAMDIETAYLGNLASVASWASDGATLTFSDGSGSGILAYEVAAEVSIVGSWVATGINNGSGGVVSSTITSEVRADLSADGELTGFDGCNDYSTSYQLDGDAIAISDAISSTRMACASDGLAEQSAQYFAALVASTSWSIDVSGRLELRDDSGALQVSFQPAAS